MPAFEGGEGAVGEFGFAEGAGGGVTGFDMAHQDQDGALDALNQRVPFGFGQIVSEGLRDVLVDLLPGLRRKFDILAGPAGREDADLPDEFG